MRNEWHHQWHLLVCFLLVVVSFDHSLSVLSLPVSDVKAKACAKGQLENNSESTLFIYFFLLATNSVSLMGVSGFPKEKNSNHFMSTNVFMDYLGSNTEDSNMISQGQALTAVFL